MMTSREKGLPLWKAFEANDDKNKNKKFQQTSTGQSLESYVQKFRISIKLFPTVAGLNYHKW